MTRLSEVEVLVLDCQTTSSSPTEGVVIEIGWAVLRTGKSLEVRSELVALPAGHRLPAPVGRITGIAPEDLVAAPPPETVWSALCAEVADLPSPTPTVIHFARFERSFLEPLHARTHPSQSFAFDVVCTHEIARRLLPELPRRSLRALAGYFGFDSELLRRSGGHVAATAHVWRQFVRELDGLGIRDFGALSGWLDETPATSRRGARGFPVARDQRLSLVDAPGVYRFMRRGGGVLYIGKASSLKRRVNSYFTKRRGMDERLLEMLSQARDIEVTVTATALEAAILESDEIKRHRPPYNVLLHGGAREAWFASPDLVEARAVADERYRVGPLPSRYALASFAALCRALADPDRGTSAMFARAMAEAPGLGPTREELSAGVRCFCARHRVGLAHPERELMQLSKRLSALARAGSLDEGEPSDGRPRPWDPERVARHIERVALQAGQLVRRARLLCLLSESAVSWHEPGQPARRLLVIEAAQIVERVFIRPELSTPAPPSFDKPPKARRAAFDIAAYDRLRVLSTELKRISSVSDDPEVRLSPTIALSGTALRRALDVC
jgi:DNA polymerase III subunit epsilon